MKKLKIGDKVRLKPKNSADAFDTFLQDQIAIVEKVEIDFEDKEYFVVSLEKDAGRDLEKSIAHRFFFSENELELL